MVSYPENDLTGFQIGDYELLQPIGSGAMADVYLARQKSLDRQVAMKILRSEWAENETYVQRFIQEAKAAAQLEHPNIVHIYEVGTRDGRLLSPTSFIPRLLLRLVPFLTRSKTHSHEATLYFIAQEYVPGVNLREYLRTCKQVLPYHALSIAHKVALALARAEESGIVHRDIKPENILLSESGDVKIADFGLARIDTDSAVRGDLTSLSLTQMGMALGTPLYMSPEQARGLPLDSRSDQYSLGVTLWHTLAGRPPFSAPTPLAVVMEHIHTAPELLHEIRPEVPASVSRLVDRMMAKAPGDRYPSFRALDDAIVKIIKEEGSGSKRDAFASLLGGQAGSITPLAGQDTALNDSMNLSRVSQTLSSTMHSMRRLDVHRRERRQRKATRAVILLLALPAAAFLGTGLGYLQSTRWTRSFSSPVAIERLASVEEQWVFASQTGTAAAWQSVIDYFPDQPSWVLHAKEQLARTCMLEGKEKEAKALFLHFSESNPNDSPVHHFGVAGLAWVLANEGNVDEAAFLLSSLRSNRESGYDRLTEDAISRAQAVIRASAAD
ncbi:MAG: serine/threonine-protein kinase [Planctomycetia bacterium]|nr:serine/threonine-protein kinase [Planctomycetia bacterium]